MADFLRMVMRQKTPFILLLAALVSLSALMPERAEAQPPPAKHRITYNANVAARYNPLGLFLFGDVSFTERLYRSRNVLLAQNHVSIGVAPQLSPGFARVGAKLEVQPLSIFKVWAAYDYGAWFGTFNFMQTFPSANSDWSDTAHRELDDSPNPNDHAFLSKGRTLTLGAQFQIKVGNIALRNIFRAEMSHWEHRPGDRIIYTSIHDVPVIADGGWLLVNDLALFYFFNETGWLIAGRYNWTRAIYNDDAYTPEEIAANVPREKNHMHRLGPGVGYTFKSRGPGFQDPMLVLFLNWYAKHRFRTGEDVHGAIPYVAIAYLMKGDLLRRN